MAKMTAYRVSSTTNNNERNSATNQKYHQHGTGTRICIKNVPPSWKRSEEVKRFIEEQIRKIGDEKKIKGIVTDCKLLINNKTGRSKQIAFIGFSTKEMTTHVVEYLNGTYARTSRLHVTYATPIQQLKQKQTEQNRSTSEKEKETKSRIIREDVSSSINYQKEEFLAAHNVKKSNEDNNRNTSSFWANDDGHMPPSESKNLDRGNAIKDDDNNDENNTSNDNLEENEYEKKDNEKVSDNLLNFMKSKMSNVQNFDDDDTYSEKLNEKMTSVDKDNKQVESNVKPSTKQSKDNDVNNENKTNRLFVRNLPFSTTEEELKDAFSSLDGGDDIECHIPIDDSNRNKGYAFITFPTVAQASHAMNTLDGLDFQGRILHILSARRPKNEEQTSFSFSGDEVDVKKKMTYKDGKEIERKANANDQKGQSSTHIRSDAVVDNLADRLNLEKGQVWNLKDSLSSGQAAIRLALGETHILEENSEFFKKHSIDLFALTSSSDKNKKIKRSSTLILVKNLPYQDTTEADLLQLFHNAVPQQAPKQILLPPSKTIALVEYDQPSHARRAFRKLSYTRFKQTNVPLYLEYAPLSAKIDVSTHADKDNKSAINTPSTESSLSPNENAESGFDESSSSSNIRSIYVKNLNFSTSEKKLHDFIISNKQYVSSLQHSTNQNSKVVSVRIPTKAAPMKNSERNNQLKSSNVQTLSMGYGFIECNSQTLAQEIVKNLNGKVLDGHQLEMKLSSSKVNNNRSISNSKKTKDVKGSKKLMVRNVPFQATRTEILQLFGSFGQLKKVRLPKKFDGTHRGFAFVEFLTVKEAQNAMESLAQTHLYGRHLVIEYAKEEDVGQKRQHNDMITSAHQGSTQNKKIRFN